MTSNDTPHGIGFNDMPARRDRLGVDKFARGVARFITRCDTPFTLSLQGGWGTGKTTMLHLVEGFFEGSHVKHTVWFRTWQYANLGKGENLTMLLLQQLITDLQNNKDAVSPKKLESFKEAGKTLGGVLGQFSLNFLDNSTFGVASAAYTTVANAASKSAKTTPELLFDLHKALEDIIDAFVGDDPEGRIVIFVDDLDRLEPSAAVELLEGIKNLVDCKRCVFVIAVDFEVVRLGIREKYGDSVDSQQFFDKIIQMPVLMPVGRYDMAGYVADIMSRLDFVLALEPEKRDEWIGRYQTAATAILDSNPRSIKRAFNLLQLREQLEYETGQLGSLGRYLTFLVLLLQVAKGGRYTEISLKEQESVDALRDFLGEYPQGKAVLACLNELADKDDRREMLLTELADVIRSNGSASSRNLSSVEETADVSFDPSGLTKNLSVVSAHLRELGYQVLAASENDLSFSSKNDASIVRFKLHAKDDGNGTITDTFITVRKSDRNESFDFLDEQPCVKALREQPTEHGIFYLHTWSSVRTIMHIQNLNDEGMAQLIATIDLCDEDQDA